MRNLGSLNAGQNRCADRLELEYGCVDWFDYQADRQSRPAGTAIAEDRKEQVPAPERRVLIVDLRR